MWEFSDCHRFFVDNRLFSQSHSVMSESHSVGSLAGLTREAQRLTLL